MCFEFGFACLSDVPNPRLTCLTGFMFKQKQRANSANTHKHLCGHTLHARTVKCTEDSLLPFWLKQWLKGVWPTVLCVSKTYTLSLSWRESAPCLILFVPHIHRKTLTHLCPLTPWQGHFGASLWICNVSGQMFVLKQMVAAKSFKDTSLYFLC